jgi:regulator of protease activity HflC (stomatin/prohibitin superfamily)
LFFGAFYVVPTGHRGIVTTFGNPDMTAKSEGIHFKIPFAQNAVIMEVRTQKYQAELTAASKDLQNVKTTIAINYHLLSESVPKIYVTMGQDYSERVIMPMEQEANKGITAKFTAEELITKREQVRQEMKELLTVRLKERDIIVEDVSIVNFEFSESFTAAIEAKVTAEQNALKEQNNLKVVEFQAQQKIKQAEGEAGAIQIVNEQLLKSPQYINYLTIQRWNGVMPLSLGSGTLLSINGVSQ